MPHGDRADETGPAAVPCPSLQRFEADLPDAPIPQLGEGADLPGRPPAGSDLRRRGTAQPPAPQDAVDGVPGTNSADDQRPDNAGYVSRLPKYLPRGKDEVTPPRQAPIIPGDGAKVSIYVSSQRHSLVPLPSA
jgi:hypothetical protein